MQTARLSFPSYLTSTVGNLIFVRRKLIFADGLWYVTRERMDQHLNPLFPENKTVPSTSCLNKLFKFLQHRYTAVIHSLCAMTLNQQCTIARSGMINHLTSKYSISDFLLGGYIRTCYGSYRLQIFFLLFSSSATTKDGILEVCQATALCVSLRCFSSGSSRQRCNMRSSKQD